MFLFHSHSGFRYLILLAGIATIAYALYSRATGRPHDKNMKNLAVTYRVLLDLNLFIGVAMIVTGYGFFNDLGVHILLMVLATAIAHVVPAVMRKRTQEERTVIPYAVATTISLVVVALGILARHRPVVG